MNIHQRHALAEAFRECPEFLNALNNLLDYCYDTEQSNFQQARAEGLDVSNHIFNSIELIEEELPERSQEECEKAQAHPIAGFNINYQNL